MPYEWNPLWLDVIDNINPVYVAKTRQMIMASINWLAEHPQANPEWREPNQDSRVRQAGLPRGSRIVVTGAWEDMYIPKNSYARHWFRAIANACGRGREAPSAFMMSKAVACGMLFKQQGWEAFDRTMLE